MPETAADAPLPPGSTIGILGGGQLGRMLAMAAARLGLKTATSLLRSSRPRLRRRRDAHHSGPTSTIVAAPSGASPAAVDVVTFEFENVPVDTARHLADAIAPVRPGAEGTGGGPGPAH